jgi:hypothetical protein
MYMIPLNQIESVDLVIHALRAAGGEADCTMCPVRKVCTKQCLAIAEGIQQMVATGTLPAMATLGSDVDEDPPDKPDGDGSGPNLRVVK